MKKEIIWKLLVFLILIWIYFPLFTLRSFILGDFPFLFPSMYKDIFLSPLTWSFNGLGSFNAPLLWVQTAFAFPVNILGNILHLPWTVITNIGFFFPFFVLSFLSIHFLSKKVFPQSQFSFLAVLVFLTNTYLLMLIGGGQIMIALAYAICPIVLLVYFHLFEKPDIMKALLAGIVLSIEMLFDLRIIYVTLVGIGIYVLYKTVYEMRINNGKWRNIFRIARNIVYLFIVPGLVVVLLHTFWILPIIIHHQNPIAQLGSAYDSLSAVKFFSFANFENALGLLHPNWPENIFGFTHFMRPEFLLLPILAFSSLFFIGKKKPEEEKRENLYVIYFVLLGLVGIFLAKGANDPFGGIYLWMFGHVPGFIMFRDPTKWYLLIALSYSMLIPYTVSKIYEKLKEKFA